MKFLQCSEGGRADRAELRRRHLISTARTLFIDRGFHSTGMAQIAAASGIRVGQIYRDFASKEDIIAAIVEHDVADFLDEDELAVAVGACDHDAIRGWITRFGSFEEEPGECRLMAEITAEAARNPRIAEINRAIDAKVRDSLLAALDALAPGDERAVGRARLVELILTMGAGLMCRRAINPHEPMADLLAHVGAIITGEIDALAGDGAGGGGHPVV